MRYALDAAPRLLFLKMKLKYLKRPGRFPGRPACRKSLAEFRALWARKGLQSFSAAACTSPKIHFAERSVELSAFGGQPRREAQRRSPSAARGRGTLLSKKGRREPFLTVSASGEVPRTPASVFGCCQQTFTIQPRVSGILPHCMPVSSSYSLWVRDPILLSFITCSTSL